MPIRRQLPVCRTGEVAPGQTKHFPFGNGKGIVYNDAGTLKAYINRCTHMGGPLSVCGPERWRCGWHQAEFDPRTGAQLCGQAPEGSMLTPIQLFTQGDQVLAVLELPDDPFA